MDKAIYGIWKGLVLGAMFIGCSGCSFRGDKTEAKRVEKVGIEYKGSSKEYTEHEKEWKSKEVVTVGKIDAQFFLNDQMGWIAQGGNLSKTRDAGRTWENSPLPRVKEGLAKQIFFEDEFRGWVFIAKEMTNLTPESEMTLFYTEDGGKNWHFFQDFRGLRVNKIDIDREGRLWIVGTKTYRPFERNRSRNELNKLVCYEGFILTIDRSERKSEDLSKQANKAVDNRGPYGCTNAGFVGIEFDERNVPHVLTSSGQLLESLNSIVSWETPWKTENKDYIRPNGLRSFGRFSDGKYWMLSSIKSVEGAGSQFYLDLLGDNSVVALADKVIDEVRCISGSVLIGRGRKLLLDQTNDQLLEEAIIVESNDFGRTWNEIYHDQESRTISSFSVVDANAVWALTDKNILLHVRREP